jgi:hypothetical protein
MAATVPNVPGIPGIRPTPNQIEEIRAILSKRPRFLIAFVNVNITDSVVDMKHERIFVDKHLNLFIRVKVVSQRVSH